MFGAQRSSFIYIPTITKKYQKILHRFTTTEVNRFIKFLDHKNLTLKELSFKSEPNQKRISRWAFNPYIKTLTKNPVFKPESRFFQYVDLRLTSAKVLQESDTTKL